MSREALALWREPALALTEVRAHLGAPVHVVMSEAVELVRFCRDHWDPISSGEMARPGLREAGSKLPETTVSDLLVLQEAMHTAQTDYLLTVPPLHAGLRGRAELVLGELISAIEWLLDDGQHDECDQQLATLRQEHAQQTNGIESLGNHLADYAALASQLRPRLVGLSGFKMSLVDDAHHLARELRQIVLSVSASDQTAQALDMRNRIATLLTDRMALVRSAARFVFRNHPSVARLALSTFDLRRRTALQHRPFDMEAIVEKLERVVTS